MVHRGTKYLASESIARSSGWKDFALVEAGIYIVFGYSGSNATLTPPTVSELFVVSRKPAGPCSQPCY